MDLSGSWDYIESIARSRLAHNKTRRHVSVYGDQIEVLGVAGEIIARRFLGLGEVVHDTFDRGVDLKCGGVKIDVKATVLTSNLMYRYLQWPVGKRVNSDVILMTAVSLPEKSGVVLGYATKKEIAAAPVNRERYIPCHEIPVRDLHPAWELMVPDYVSKNPPHCR